MGKGSEFRLLTLIVSLCNSEYFLQSFAAKESIYRQRPINSQAHLLKDYFTREKLIPKDKLLIPRNTGSRPSIPLFKSLDISLDSIPGMK